MTVAFHSIISFENLAIPWLFARLPCVNVDKVMRNYVCSGKRNFHVLVLADTVACNQTRTKHFGFQSASFVYTKANKPHPIHGAVIFRMKGTVPLKGKLIVTCISIL